MYTVPLKQMPCKNSWGTNDGTDGFRFISEQQLLLSTILIMAKTGDN